jgi:hypothetical protein
MVKVTNLAHAEFNTATAVCVDSKGNTHVVNLDLDWFQDRGIKVDVGSRIRIPVGENLDAERRYLAGL